jgi:chromosome segregation and condensation protein ScpB
MYQEKLRKQRENPETSRAGLKWEVDEDNALISKIDENVNIDEIAKQLQRTSGSIKTRLIVKALILIDEDHSITLDQAAERYKITTQDIQAYQANKKKRQMTNSLRNTPVNLNSIYSLLMEINSKLS